MAQMGVERRREARRSASATGGRIMDELGGNIYMIIKIGTVTGHGLYQIGAHQRGETYEEFLATRNASGAR